MEDVFGSSRTESGRKLEAARPSISRRDDLIG